MMNSSNLASRISIIFHELIKALIIYPSVIAGLSCGALYLHSDMLMHQYYLERSEASQMTASPGHFIVKECVLDALSQDDLEKDFSVDNKILVEPVKCSPVFRELSVDVATNEAVSTLNQLYYSCFIIGIFCYLGFLVVRIKEHKDRKKAMKHHQASINTI